MQVLDSIGTVVVAGSKATLTLAGQIFSDRRKILYSPLAQVVWLKYFASGLQFSWNYRLDGPVPDELKFIRKLWNYRRTRLGVVE